MLPNFGPLGPPGTPGTASRINPGSGRNLLIFDGSGPDPDRSGSPGSLSSPLSNHKSVSPEWPEQRHGAHARKHTRRRRRESPRSQRQDTNMCCRAEQVSLTQNIEFRSNKHVWADIEGPQLDHSSFYLSAVGPKIQKYPRMGLVIDLRV